MEVRHILCDNCTKVILDENMCITVTSEAITCRSKGKTKGILGTEDHSVLHYCVPGCLSDAILELWRELE